MSTNVWRGLSRSAVLICVFGILAGLLMRQRKVLEIQRRQDLAQNQLAPLPVADDGSGIQFGLSVDLLSQQLLKSLPASRTDVGRMCDERRKEIVWRGLLVPADIDMWTESRIVEERLQFRLRELESYRQLTKDTGEARLAGERFVEAYLQEAARQHDTPRDFQSLFVLGQAALDAGSRDPLVRAFYAYHKLEVDQDIDAATKIRSEILIELRETEYPKIVQFYVSQALYDSVWATNSTESVPRWRQLALATVHWLEEESKNPRWLRWVCHRLLLTWDKASFENRTILLSACMQSSQIDPYIVHWLAGDYFIQLAWERRSTKFASELTNTQAEQFSKYIRIASEHLQYAWSQRPELPHAAAKMVTVAKSGVQRGESPYFWFVQTIHAQFDYYLAYSALLDSLLPRWGGSQDQMLEFADNCLGTDRFATFVPYFALEVLDKIKRYEGVAIVDNPAEIKLLRKFYEARKKRRIEHPDEQLYDRHGAHMAQLVKMLRDSHQDELASELLRDIGQNINWTYLRKDARPARYLAAQFVAGSKNDRAQLDTFDEALRRPWDITRSDEDLAILMSQYQTLKDRPSTDDTSPKEFYRHVDVILNQLRGFSAGEWVAMSFAEGLPGWEPYCDSWRMLDEKRVELSGESGGAPQVCLRPLANFHPPLEVEAELEIVKPMRQSYAEPVAIGWSIEGKWERFHYPVNRPLFQIEIQQSKDSLYLDSARIYAGANFHGAKARLRTTGPHHFQIRLWKNCAEFRVDGTSWMTASLPEGLRSDGWLCFGESYSHSDGALRGSKSSTMRWNDIRVKRLDIDEAPVETTSLEHQVEYWERRSTAAPDDLIAAVQKCEMRFRQQRYDEALKMADQILEKTPEINGVHKWKAFILNDGYHDYSEAMKELRIADDEPNDDPEILSRIAEIFAAAPDDSLRSGARAKSIANMMLLQTAEKNAPTLAALAAAHAELGEFDEAIRRHEAAMRLATEAEKIHWQTRQALYESHQPLRLPEAANQDRVK